MITFCDILVAFFKIGCFLDNVRSCKRGSRIKKVFICLLLSTLLITLVKFVSFTEERGRGDWSGMVVYDVGGFVLLITLFLITPFTRNDSPRRLLINNSN